MDAGHIVVRLGAKFTDKDEFSKYDKAVEKARRERDVKTALKGDFDKHAFNQYERALRESRSKAERQKAFKAHLGADYDRRAFNQYEKALKTSTTQTRSASHEADRHGKALRTVGHGAAYALGAGGFGGGLYAIFDVLKKSIGAYKESQKATRDTEAILKSSGHAAGLTAKQIASLSFAISQKTGVDDEAIQRGQNMLLTFKDVRDEVGKGNNVFTRTSKAAVDMSARFDQGLKPSFIQLGKALNDPIKGISALQRIGVQFSQGQKDQIKGLVEHGHRLKAQRLILKEVESQTRGSAAAQATASEKLKVNLGNLAEVTGRAVAPALAKVTQSASKFVGQMVSGHGQGGRFVKTLKGIWEGVKPIVTWVGRATANVAKFASHHHTVTKLAVAIGAVGLAVNAMRTSKALGGINTLIGGLRRLARTKAGEAAADSITSALGGVPGRTEKRLGRVRSIWRRVLGGAGASAGERAGDSIVHSTGAQVNKGRGRLRGSIGSTLRAAVGPAAIAAAILGADYFAKKFGEQLLKHKSGIDRTLGQLLSGKHYPGEKDSHGPSSITDLRQLFKQHGGPVKPGAMAIVGEAGPELIKAGTQGAHVTPIKAVSETPRLGRSKLGIAEGLEAERRKALAPIKRIGTDLGEIPKKALDAGKRTNKAMGDNLQDAAKDGKRHSTRLKRDVTDNFEDTRKTSTRSVKRLKDDSADHLDDLRKKATRHATRMGNAVGDQAKDMQRGVNRVVKRMADTAADRFGDMARAGRRQGGRLSGSVKSSMGSVDRATHTGLSYIADATNKALKAFDAKPVHLSVPKPKGFAAGGIPNRAGSPHDDHFLISPQGRPVAALSGTEGIVNDPQMDAIDRALSVAQSIGEVPWGSLEELWGSGMRHRTGGKLRRFAAGGRFTGPGHSGEGFTPVWNMARSKFGMNNFTGFDGHNRLTTSGNVSEHYMHRALDMSNGVLTPQEDALASFFKRKTPQVISQLIWRDKIQAGHGLGGTVTGHQDHVHLGMLQQYAFNASRMAKILSRAQRGLSISSLLVGGGGGGGGSIDVDHVDRLKVEGTTGPARTIVQSALNKARSGANRFLDKRASRAGGGVDTGPLHDGGGLTPEVRAMASRIGHRYGVNPRLLLAIAKHETNFGAAGLGRRGLYLGVGAFDTGASFKWAGWAKQLTEGARLLSSWGVHDIGDVLAGKASRWATSPAWEAGVAGAYRSFARGGFLDRFQGGGHRRRRPRRRPHRHLSVAQQMRQLRRLHHPSKAQRRRLHRLEHRAHHPRHHRRRRGAVADPFPENLDELLQAPIDLAALTPSTADDIAAEREAVGVWEGVLRWRQHHHRPAADISEAATTLKSHRDALNELQHPEQADAGGADASGVDTSADLQAQLEQANLKVATAQESTRLASAAFNVFGGSGDIGAGGQYALRAGAYPFPGERAGAGLGVTMNPTTGALSGALPGMGQGFAPPIIVNAHSLVPADSRSLQAVGNAAAAGFSQQGYVTSPRERIGP